MHEHVTHRRKHGVRRGRLHHHLHVLSGLSVSRFGAADSLDWLLDHALAADLAGVFVDLDSVSLAATLLVALAAWLFERALKDLTLLFEGRPEVESDVLA